MSFSALEAADLVHLGYTLMLCALLARDVLRLRAILVAAQSTLAAYAWFTDRPSMAAWNALFVLINFLWVLRILKERREVELPPDLRLIHAHHFSAFTAPEFLRFWNLGEPHEVRDAQLTTAGVLPAELMFLVDGEVQVMHQGRTLATLGVGSFIGEMSLVTDRPATADALTLGRARLRGWPMPQVRALRSRQPLLYTRLQSAIGHDLVEKIRRTSSVDS